MGAHKQEADAFERSASRGRQPSRRGGTGETIRVVRRSLALACLILVPALCAIAQASPLPRLGRRGRSGLRDAHAHLPLRYSALRAGSRLRFAPGSSTQIATPGRIYPHGYVVLVRGRHDPVGPQVLQIALCPRPPASHSRLP
jgi:hypothetical protein